MRGPSRRAMLVTARVENPSVKAAILSLGSRARVVPDNARLRLQLTAAGAVGLGLCVISVAVTLSGPTANNQGFAAAGRALMVGVPIAVGLYAWHRRPQERFGPL